MSVIELKPSADANTDFFVAAQRAKREATLTLAKKYIEIIPLFDPKKPEQSNAVIRVLKDLGYSISDIIEDLKKTIKWSASFNSYEQWCRSYRVYS